MTTHTRAKNPVKGVERAFHILETVEEHHNLRLTDIAAEVGLARSTTHRYLKTLESMGYLVRDDNQYTLSHQFLRFATHVRTRDPRYSLIDEKVQQLAQETGELVQFIIEEHGQTIYVLQSIGENGVQINTKLGKSDPVHTTAAGKAILSTWSTAEVDNLIDEYGLPELTPQSITSRDELFEEIDRIQTRGYSVNNQENVDGLKAVSVPIMDSRDRALGSLSVSGPTHRMKGDWFTDELPDLLLGISNELELNFRYLQQSSPK
ncbi:IclR family transcriptional regulator [Natronococcus sp. A-GB7]|uniref:IclR family transcriptional regulator n=1 Tax=Natronococcus sp. A-GB7 TaxID=3037649 RepID=UPI00241E7CFF|nr:IclR family transcriptional regulator [Natronococcus sp. A-GB7]MDG5820747.1 IclR family transcriptional regulator [Natronococcus sp. A-GB7]